MVLSWAPPRRTQSAVASNASAISPAAYPRRLMLTTSARRTVTADAKSAPRRRNDRNHARSLPRRRLTNTSAGRAVARSSSNEPPNSPPDDEQPDQELQGCMSIPQLTGHLE